jgi:hypothetical protein
LRILSLHTILELKGEVQRQNGKSLETALTQEGKKLSIQSLLCISFTKQKFAKSNPSTWQLKIATATYEAKATLDWWVGGCW